MKPGTVVAALLVIAGIALCARLGVWQISRLHEKQALNAAMRAAIDAPAIDMAGRALPLEQVEHRRVTLRGRFEPGRQVLLAGRAQSGLPGVAVVTPFRMASDSSLVLVDRGWLYAPDAAHARPQDTPEPNGRDVTGIATAIQAGQSTTPWLRLEADSVTLWSARTLDPDSLAAHIGLPLAPYVVRELPGPGVPDKPLRLEPRPLDTSMHLGYAVQWFLFGAILLIGSLVLARSRRGDPVAPPP